MFSEFHHFDNVVSYTFHLVRTDRSIRSHSITSTFAFMLSPGCTEEETSANGKVETLTSFRYREFEDVGVVIDRETIHEC